MAFKATSSHLAAPLPVAFGLEVSQPFTSFCGETGELERDRESACIRKIFSDVFRSVFMRRALSDGESKLLICFALELLIAWRVNGVFVSRFDRTNHFVSLIRTSLLQIRRQ